MDMFPPSFFQRTRQSACGGAERRGGDPRRGEEAGARAGRHEGQDEGQRE